jgi:hypothetical protein
MCRQCKLILHLRPMRIQYIAVSFKMWLQSGFMWRYSEFSSDGAVKLIYTYNVSSLNSTKYSNLLEK